jgi:hypothetical protein
MPAVGNLVWFPTAGGVTPSRIYLFTVCWNVGEVLVRKFESPE